MIRPAVPGDAAAITALVERAHALYVPRIGSTATTPWPA